MQFCMVLLHTYSEGRVSQIFYLGFSFYFMLFRKNVSKVSKKLPVFLNKIKTNA